MTVTGSTPTTACACPRSDRGVLPRRSRPRSPATACRSARLRRRSASALGGPTASPQAVDQGRRQGPAAAQGRVAGDRRARASRPRCTRSRTRSTRARQRRHARYLRRAGRRRRARSLRRHRARSRATWPRAACETLIVLGGNPVYDAPADLNFERRARARCRRASACRVTSRRDRRARAPGTCRARTSSRAGAISVARDGTYAVQQPLIAPLFDGAQRHRAARPRSRRRAERDRHRLVRATAAARGYGDELAWQRAAAARRRRRSDAQIARRGLARCRTPRSQPRCARCPSRGAPSSDSSRSCSSPTTSCSTAATRTTRGCSSCPTRSRASPGTTRR